MISDREPRVLLCWSSGKDSAWTLHVLRRAGTHVAALLSTINAAFDRVAMHAVRTELLEAQAQAAGCALIKSPIPFPCTNEEYESAMEAALREARERFQITHVAFGDLFLEDVRAYREERLRDSGLTPLFPLWGVPTDVLAREMIDSGLRAVLTCIDPKKLPRSLAGRTFDAALLADLPAGTDPCGERGEFHSFAYAGPMFTSDLSPIVGEVVERDGFVFADVLLAEGDEATFDEYGALTREYLLKRGFCCGSGCRNCPYDHVAVPRP
jgi:uncharacterized protein (TIGR00290 family)